MKKLKILCSMALTSIIVNIVFVDIAFAETYNNYSNNTVSCGSKLVTNIPATLPKVISILYIAIQVVVPILLVIFGSLDLIKGVTAQKEDEIKKGQQMFIKRLISAVLVFFIFVAVKLVISLAADGTSNKILQCTECFIKNNKECK